MSGGSDDVRQEPHQRGDTDGPMEDDLEQAFDRLLDEGVQRLGRGWLETLVTGFFGGTEVALGVLALVAVLHETGNQLLAGLAFSIGLMALVLARSELFTEGFLVPVTTVVARRGRGRDLGRLWLGTLVGNLVGGWVITWLVVLAFPAYVETVVESASHFATAEISAETLSLALLAGAFITLLTRMQHGTDDVVAKLVACAFVGFLLAGLEMFHSVLDSLLIFAAIHTGEADFGYLDWASWFWWVTLANVVGGLGLVTLLRLVRSRYRIAEERAAVEEEQTGR